MSVAHSLLGELWPDQCFRTAKRFFDWNLGHR